MIRFVKGVATPCHMTYLADPLNWPNVAPLFNLFFRCWSEGRCFNYASQVCAFYLSSVFDLPAWFKRGGCAGGKLSGHASLSQSRGSTRPGPVGDSLAN